MWESRRDFQRVWEGWEAGFMAFHTFHTLSFPWPAFSLFARQVPIKPMLPRLDQPFCDTVNAKNSRTLCHQKLVEAWGCIPI
jgi:hypothetical protein